MNNTRHASPAFTRALLRLLLLSYAVCTFCLIVLNMYKTDADEALQLANEAVKAAEASNDIALRYQNQNQALSDQNYLLRNILSSYHNNEVFAESPTPPQYFDVAMSKELQSYTWIMCCNYCIEEHYELVYALIQHESKFDAAAISSSNDWGLMQININNHVWLSEELGIVDFLDPFENVHGGIHMIASLLHKYDVTDALMAYNMGENGAAKLWRRGIHSTTYTDQVLDCYKQFTGDI